MSKNKVQLQSGYSLIDLFQHSGTETQCREVLFKWRWPTGFNCSECGDDRDPLISSMIQELSSLLSL